MNYHKMASRYYTLTKQIGYLEKQRRRGDTDISVAQEIEQLRQEQKRVEEKIDEYNARYNVESWRCD